METKVCKKCGRELPIEMFGKDATRKDGHSYYCKDCINAKNAKYNARKREAKRRKTSDALTDVATESLIVELRKRSSILFVDPTPRDLLVHLHSLGYRGTLEYDIVETKKINLASIA